MTNDEGAKRPGVSVIGYRLILIADC